MKKLQEKYSHAVALYKKGDFPKLQEKNNDDQKPQTAVA